MPCSYCQKDGHNVRTCPLKQAESGGVSTSNETGNVASRMPLARSPVDSNGSAHCTRPADDGPIFVFYDTETTGLGRDDEIIELAMIRVEARDVLLRDDLHQLSLRFRPTKKSFPFATAVHGIRYEDLAHLPTFGESQAAVLSFICQVPNRRVVMVAHNEAFDRRMLDAEFARAGGALPRGIGPACTKKLFGALKGEGRIALANLKLSTIFEHILHKPLEGAHCALEDASALVKLVRDLSDGTATGRDGPDVAPLTRLLAQCTDVTNLEQQMLAMQLGATAAVGATASASELPLPVAIPVVCEAVQARALREHTSLEDSALAAGSSSADAPTASCRCLCGAAAKERVVKKDGPNKGRRFANCAKGESGCRFFRWLSSEVVHCHCECNGTREVAALRTVTKDSANRGRLFYGCAKARGDQCGFFLWESDLEGSGSQDARGSPAP